MYEKKPGDISIFRNDRKEKETHPDYRGVGLGVDGQKIKVALWLKKDRNGNAFMAGKIEPDTYEGGSASGEPSRKPERRYEMDDDVPFIRW